MRAQIQPGLGPEASLPELVGRLRYFARQPILDLRGRVHGYELLFRNGPEMVFLGDGDEATRTMLDNTVMFGLDELTAGLPAFVNCTRESLVDELVHVLPPGMTVLEILESLEPTPALIAACRKLKSAGFRLALDDFTWRPGIEPLVEIADYIKVDFAATGCVERKEILERIDGRAVALVAEKVETQAAFREACEEGFTLIQGYHFCRPILFKGWQIPANRLSHLQILQLLQSRPLDIPLLSDQVKRDPSLAYRLLRIVNSPVCAMRQEVRSIEAALVLVGDETFRRVATLAIATELNTGRTPELLRMAFVRGRFCELAARFCGMDPIEQYLMGMLSLLPAMLRVPMEELAPGLPLRAEVRKALEGADTPERCLLDWLERHERGNWEGCDALAQERGLHSEGVLRCYADAVVWAEAALHAAG